MDMGESSNKKSCTFKLAVCLKKFKSAALSKIKIEIKVGALYGHG